MPQYINPYKGFVIVPTETGNTIRVSPGAMVMCADHIAARMGLIPVGQSPAVPPPVPRPTMKSGTPAEKQKISAPTIPVPAPKTTAEIKPQIIPEPPVAPSKVVTEPKPIGVPIPAVEPTVEDKGKSLPDAIAPEKPLPEEAEKAADEIAKAILKEKPAVPPKKPPVAKKPVAPVPPAPKPVVEPVIVAEEKPKTE